MEREKPSPFSLLMMMMIMIVHEYVKTENAKVNVFDQRMMRITRKRNEAKKKKLTIATSART